MNIKKGDQVKILAGKDRGKTGNVLRILAKEERVVVEGINTFTKRVRPKKAGQKGESVVLPRAVAISNAQLVCKNCKKPTRVGSRMNGDKKERFCKKCDATT